MTDLALFLFTTLVDLVLLLLVIRIFSSRWVSEYNQINKAIGIMTDPLLTPIGHASDPLRLSIISIMLAIMIEFLSGLILFGMNCITGPGVLNLFLFSGLKILDLIFTIFFFSIILHAIFSWLMPNQHSSASDFIRQLVVPVLNPIRRHLPVPAGLDFSPFIAIILIQSFSLLINENITEKLMLNGIVCANLQQLV
jgi:YggT family protein